MADLEITALVALTDPIGADLLVMVDDVAGTPITKKITREDFFNNSLVFNEAGTDSDLRAEGDTATNLLVLDAGLDAVQIGTTTAGVIADFRTTGIVFNENGADRDLRIEGDTDTVLINTDAATDMVGIGIVPVTAKLHVKATTGSIAKFGDGTSDARFEMLRDTGAGAEMQFHAGDSIMAADGNWQLKHGATSKIKLKNAGNGAEVWIDTVTPSMYTGGGDDFFLGRNAIEMLRFTATGPVINEASADLDFRMETDTDANGFFMDASANAFGFFTNAPVSKVDLNTDVIRIRTAKTPASAAAAGNQGDIAWDTSFIYVCTATNTWKRILIATW